LRVLVSVQAFQRQENAQGKTSRRRKTQASEWRTFTLRGGEQKEEEVRDEYLNK